MESYTCQNIVGYTTVTPYDPSGAAWAGQNFVKCGGDALKITEILDPATLEYGDMIQIWDKDDVVFVAYMWNGGGWEDGDLNVVGLDVPDFDVPNGMGINMLTVNPVVFAGEVKTDVTEVVLAEGVSLASSLFPIAFDLDKCDFSAFEYGDSIQVWDANEFAWVLYMWNGGGWEDADLNEVTGVVAQAGEAFFVSVANSATYTQASPL